MGILIIVVACAAVIMAGTMAMSGGQSFDLATIALIIVGFSGACALGIGFINTWRTPMLTVQRNVGISFVGLHLNTPNIPPQVIQDSPLVDSHLKR